MNYLLVFVSSKGVEGRVEGVDRRKGLCFYNNNQNAFQLMMSLGPCVLISRWQCLIPTAQVPSAGMPAGVHRSDAAWLQHGQAALRRTAGQYPSPCMFRVILKKNSKTAEMGMILMLGFACSCAR